MTVLKPECLKTTYLADEWCGMWKYKCEFHLLVRRELQTWTGPWGSRRLRLQNI
jgi:hypothetical protein